MIGNSIIEAFYHKQMKVKLFHKEIIEIKKYKMKRIKISKNHLNQFFAREKIPLN